MQGKDFLLLPELFEMFSSLSVHAWRLETTSMYKAGKTNKQTNKHTYQHLYLLPCVFLVPWHFRHCTILTFWNPLNIVACMCLYLTGKLMHLERIHMCVWALHVILVFEFAMLRTKDMKIQWWVRKEKGTKLSTRINNTASSERIQWRAVMFPLPHYFVRFLEENVFDLVTNHVSLKIK